MFVVVSECCLLVGDVFIDIDRLIIVCILCVFDLAFVVFLVFFFGFIFFFFKQKTAYEMRISDWSSDVCSSDLVAVNSKASPDIESVQAVRVMSRLNGLPSSSPEKATPFTCAMRSPFRVRPSGISGVTKCRMSPSVSMAQNGSLPRARKLSPASTSSSVVAGEIGRAHV